MCASRTFLHCGQIERVNPKKAASRSLFAGTGSMPRSLLCERAPVQHDDGTVEVRVARRCQPGRKLAAFCRLADPSERAGVDVAALVVLGDRRAQPALEDARGDAV